MSAVERKNFNRARDAQLKATPLPAVDDPQLKLPMPGVGARPRRAEFTLDQVRAISDPIGALEMSMRCSGLLSKEFQFGLDLDKGHWSRIENGDAPFPWQKLSQFMALAGNHIPLIWQIEKEGYDFATLRKHHSEAEARAAFFEKENQDLRRALALVVNAKAG